MPSEPPPHVRCHIWQAALMSMTGPIGAQIANVIKMPGAQYADNGVVKQY